MKVISLEVINDILQLMDDYMSFVEKNNDEIYDEAFPHLHLLINPSFRGFVEYCREVLPEPK